VCVFRNTRLDDKAQVELASRFGELDDIKPYLAFGRRNRLPYDELFDVGNLDDDGNLLPLDTRRAQLNKV
jgi:alpha-ketoglutarate-dependent 2,4-dichlorophenoxyacetate dioxygenase